MGIEEKKEVVKEIKEKADRARSLCFTSFMGIKAHQMNEIRKGLKREGAEMKVFKNTLIKRAFEEKFSDDESEQLVQGPTALVFGYEDPITPLKVISDFREEEDKPVVNGVFIGEDHFDKQGFEKLATIPSREELYQNMVDTLNSPLNKMVYILSAIPRKVLTTINEIANQKEE